MPQTLKGFALVAALKADALDCQREDRIDLLNQAAREIETLTLETRELSNVIAQRNELRTALELFVRTGPSGIIGQQAARERAILALAHSNK